MDPSTTPVILLKTRSTPNDAYEESFSETQDDVCFAPVFVPVLDHKLDSAGIARLQNLLETQAIGKRPGSSHGGLIFTSQRAVEALAHVVRRGSTAAGARGWPHLQHVPVYSVGPATTRALKAVPQDPPLQVFGEHTGNGEDLAPFIIQHYGEWYRDRPSKPPILFLVGDKRRDIIPRMLMDDDLAAEQRIRVDEILVYGTGPRDSFDSDLQHTLDATRHCRVRWVVIFSPSGCDIVVRRLGILDDNKSGRMASQGQVSGAARTLIATIGPTTARHLQSTFGIRADVCSEHPNPEALLQGTLSFMRQFASATSTVVRAA